MDKAFSETIRHRLLHLSEADTAYATIENSVGARRCGLRAASLPDYWTEADQDAKWG